MVAQVFALFLVAATGVMSAKIPPVPTIDKNQLSITACHMELNTEYFSNNLYPTPQPADSPAECCDLCSEDEACAVWTWLSWQRLCYLKFSSTGRRHTKDAVGGVSRNLSLQHCRVEGNTEYHGDNMDYKRPAYAPAECCQICTNDAKCVVWTWTKSTKTCQPKFRYYQQWSRYNNDTISGSSKMH